MLKVNSRITRFLAVILALQIFLSCGNCAFADDGSDIANMSEAEYAAEVSAENESLPGEEVMSLAGEPVFFSEENGEEEPEPEVFSIVGEAVCFEDGEDKEIPQSEDEVISIVGEAVLFIDEEPEEEPEAGVEKLPPADIPVCLAEEAEDENIPPEEIFLPEEKSEEEQHEVPEDSELIPIERESGSVAAVASAGNLNLAYIVDDGRRRDSDEEKERTYKEIIPELIIEVGKQIIPFGDPAVNYIKNRSPKKDENSERDLNVSVVEEAVGTSIEAVCPLAAPLFKIAMDFFRPLINNSPQKKSAPDKKFID